MARSHVPLPLVPRPRSGHAGRHQLLLAVLAAGLLSACGESSEVRAITVSRLVPSGGPAGTAHGSHAAHAAKAPGGLSPGAVAAGGEPVAGGRPFAGAAPFAGGAPFAGSAPLAGGVTPPPSHLASGLGWSVPAGWRTAAERPMRVVTLLPGDDPDTECYVTVLAGAAGGARSNIDRWCGQMGAPPLTDEAFAALPRRPMLGVDAVQVEIAGHFSGMQGSSVADALLLGAVLTLPDRSVFVKLVGPRRLVEPLRADFLAFCDSLELAPGA